MVCEENIVEVLSTLKNFRHGKYSDWKSRCMGAAQSAGSSYDKHSQWKSRGTDAAASTESSYDTHSQWKRGSQGEGEGRTNKQWVTIPPSFLGQHLEQILQQKLVVLDHF